MKLKFRSSLNKFNPFDSQSDAKPIDLSLKSRIKNFMKKSSCDEFKASSSSLNSIKSSVSSSSINSISPTNSLNRQYDTQCRTPINVLGGLHGVPPSPPNSIEDEEESAFLQQQQQRQIYYNQLWQQQYENQQLNLTLTNLLGASHFNKGTNGSSGLLNNQQHLLESARPVNLTAYPSSRTQDHSLQELTRTDEQLSQRTASSQRSAVPNGHIHYQKQMVIKHASQMNKRNLQNHYDPYSQAAKRKCGKPISDEDEELDDYYDSAKLINKLKMKYCNPNRKPAGQSVNSNPTDQFSQRTNSLAQNARMPEIRRHSPASPVNPRDDYRKDSPPTGFIQHNIQHKPQHSDIAMSNAQPNTSHLEPLFLQTFYKEYYGYLLSQSANGKLSALQIIMKNILEQKCANSAQFRDGSSPLGNQLNQQFKSSSIETHSLSSSTPSPNYEQTNFNSLHHETMMSDIHLPSTPPSQREGNPEERKRSTRPLTGRHVRQGTGASPSTLAKLKLAIKENQKSSPSRPLKRKGK